MTTEWRRPCHAHLAVAVYFDYIWPSRGGLCAVVDRITTTLYCQFVRTALISRESQSPSKLSKYSKYILSVSLSLYYCCIVIAGHLLS